MDPQEVAQKLFSWVAWCLLEGKGYSLEGKRFNTLDALSQYAVAKINNGDIAPQISPKYPDEITQVVGVVITAMPYIRSGFPEVTLASLREQAKQAWKQQNGTENDAEFEQRWAKYERNNAQYLETNSEQLDSKQAVLIASIYFLDLLGTLELYHLGVELLDPLFLHINDLPVAQQPLLALAISAIAREQLSSQKAYDYLTSVQQYVSLTDMASQATYYFSLANILKDLGKYSEALEAYFLAESFALKSRHDMMGTLYSQIGRAYLELGDHTTADQFFGKSKTWGFDTVENYEIYARVSQAQSALRQGEIFEAIQILESLFSDVNRLEPRYQSEYLIQALAGEINLVLYSLPIAEWHFAMAVLIAELGNIKRESGTLFGQLGLIIAQQLRGPEAKYWLVKAKKTVNQHANYLNTASIHLHLAFLMYLLGMTEDSIEFFQNSIIESEKMGDILTTISSHTQLALATCIEFPETSQKATNIARELLQKNPDMPYQMISHLIARELLLSDPDVLLAWPEFLRISKSDDPITQPILQKIISNKVNVVPEDNLLSMIVPKRTLVCGKLYRYLTEHGFLDFLRRYVGIHAREAVEWILSESKSLELRQNIAIEWLINPTSSNKTMRRGHKGKVGNLHYDLRNLRRYLMRYYFEQSLLDNPKVLRKEPVSGNYEPKHYNLHSAVEELAAFYIGNRGKNYTSMVEESSDTPIPFTEKDFFQKALKGQNVTASDYGIRMENHLEWEFFEPLRNKFANQPPPILLELFQAKDKAFWVVVDLTKGYHRSSVAVLEVEFARSQADEAVQIVKYLLKKQETSGLSDVEGERQTVYQLFEPLFAPILDLLTNYTAKQISAISPWNSIPLEQLPLYPDGRCMIDFAPVLRRDRFGKSLSTPASNRRTTIPTTSIRIFGDPLLDLPFARQEAQTMADLSGIPATLGEACTYERIVSEVQQTKLLHIACHGGVLDEGYGDYVVLLLADDFLLGQEIAALNLENCQVVLLSACFSAVGQEYGVSQVESLAEYFLEAGAKAVVASQSQVSDQRTTSLMHDFYQVMLSGQPLSQAMSAAFGIAQKRKHNVLLFPWILIGDDISLVIEDRQP